MRNSSYYFLVLLEVESNAEILIIFGASGSRKQRRNSHNYFLVLLVAGSNAEILIIISWYFW